MSVDYVLAPAALGDIGEIADYLAAVDPEAAMKAIDMIYDGCAFLAGRPDVGHARPEPLQIVRVLPWRRDIERVLQNELE